MKSILLATTAMVAFAGAAAADGHTGISFSGSATLGFNTFGSDDYDDFGATATSTGVQTNWVGTSVTSTSTTGSDDNDGFYWDAEIDVTMAAELDNGLTATAEFSIDIVDGTIGETLESGDYVLSLESEDAGLFYGDTEFAAVTHFDSAGDMESDGFSEVDGETVLRGDVSFGDVDASISYTVADTDGNLATDASGGDHDVDQLSLGVAAEFGQFTVTAGYQEESDLGTTGNGDYNTGEVFGISGSASFSGADFTIAYADDNGAGTSSIGAEVSYTFSPVTATVYYVLETENGVDDEDVDDNFGVTLEYSDGPVAVALDYDFDQGTEKVILEGSYEVSDNLTLLAGAINETEADDSDFYIAGEYDLGGGAELLVSYGADDDNTSGDEIGDPEYQTGATVEISFSF